MRKRRVRLGTIVCLVLAALIAWELWPKDFFFPRLTEAVEAPAAVITVGENVQVSRSHETLSFSECVIAADPNSAGSLFAASICWPRPDERGLVGYMSDDGGMTWKASLELLEDHLGKHESLCDPTIAFGPTGDLYLAHMRLPSKTPKLGENGIGKAGYGSLDLLCLPAGTSEWQLRSRIERYIDRPWLAIDQTDGSSRGRLYCIANVGPAILFTSSDGSHTLKMSDFPKLGGAEKMTAYPAQPLVMSDGSLLAGFEGSRDRQPASDPRMFPVFRSSDGGQTLTFCGSVSDWKHAHLKPKSPNMDIFPQMAVDPGSRSFADHIYAVWGQLFQNRPATEWILFSRSTDRGRTWSPPVKLSEQSDADDPPHDYIAYIPCITVNKMGAVAVSWYDRRGLPSGGQARGWNLRIRVSLDGGTTWAPSVQVNSKPSTGTFKGWFTAGITADVSGRFHPVWLDDRTGVAQLWTASVVAGARPIPSTEASN